MLLWGSTVAAAENQPIAACNTPAPQDSATSIMSTLDQVNQAARKAAESSTGTWSSPSLAQAGAEEVPSSEAAEMQVCRQVYTTLYTAP